MKVKVSRSLVKAFGVMLCVLLFSCFDILVLILLNRKCKKRLPNVKLTDGSSDKKLRIPFRLRMILRPLICLKTMKINF